MKYIFGPVNSRRLGLSLGIDLMPHKTCSMNCVYCECGPTTVLTGSIDEYIPADEIVSELDDYLSSRPALDSITFSGSGEPTLHSGIGRIIGFLKKKYPHYSVAVLTNSSLLSRKDVRTSISGADLIMPSLDAVSDDVFNKINRPAPGITAADIIEGLVELRRDFRGIISLEIFIVPGVNDSDDEIRLIRKACRRINPDRIELNKLDRPGAEAWVRAASLQRLNEIRDMLAPINAVIIGDAGKVKHSCTDAEFAETVISTLKRRPSTLDDLASSTGMDKFDLSRIIHELVNDGIAEETDLDRGKFYRIKKSN
jgi:wyosine [tRNA(Phe)-imidazoG37] synthetase (radical SAM superfamily)